ncbi:MAG: CCA tRNA nucleotidyltransferase [Clostridia bacterium]|nr:CCA tRNA nucleotidyltransferase [Clostridia bacterium]
MLDFCNHLDENKNRILKQTALLADDLGYKIYLVGGTVRDIILNKEPLDIDLVLEGNALEFARILQRCLGGELKTHEQFLTATINWPDFSLDLISARKEIYKSYGSLPEISLGNITDDLKRRDFTINAMAVYLMDGKLLDPFGGIDDLKKGLVRILHKNSFKEDPTRILRAARYLARLKFKLEKSTYKEIKKAKVYLTDVSSSRKKNEFIKIANEKGGLKALKLLEGWGVLPYILPGVKLKKINKSFMDYFNVNIGLKEKWLILLMAIYWQTADQLQDILKVRFDLTNKEKQCLEWLINNKALLLRLTKSDIKLSFLNIHRLLYNTPPEIEVFLLWLLGEKRKLYLKEIKMARQQIKLPLSGKDLLEQGVPPGPMVGELLSALEDQILLGKISSRDEALKWLETRLEN